MIGGLNFINQPGKVHWKYSDSIPARGDIGFKPKTYGVELKPLKKTWQDSWTKSLIFLRVPDRLPGESFDSKRPGQVVITFADGISISRDMTVSYGNPVITEVATSSGNAGSCCLTIIREEWRRVSGTTNYTLQPIEFKPP